MNSVLQLLALVVIACLATFLLERGGRVGYGWVTGSEFLVAGLLLGPLGLDLVSADLLHESKVLVILASAWIGLRAGLRFRRSRIEKWSWRPLLSSQIEPVLSLLILRGALEASRALWGWPDSNWRAWIFAAIGATTTRSAVAWIKRRHGAKGPVTDVLSAITALNDLPSILAIGFLFAWVRPADTHPLSQVWVLLLASLILALALAAIVRLISGSGGFKPDLAWIALFGACAIAAGTSEPLGLKSLVVCSFIGILLGWISPYGDRFEEITRSTERPTIQLLLLLGGASIRGARGTFAMGLVFALLRLLSKLLAGGITGLIARPDGKPLPGLGMGLLAGGGVAFALAFSASLDLPSSAAEPLLAGAAAMVLLGDMVGSPALKWILRRQREMGETR